MTLPKVSRKLLATGALFLLLVSSVALVGLGMPVAGAPALAPHASPVTPAAPSGHSAPLGAGPIASGGGVFFGSTALPLAPVAQRDCFYVPSPGALCNNASMLNISNNVATNYTSGGVLAEAYTSMTNASVCPAAVNYTQSEITFVKSTNGGTTWSSPLLIGATSCAVAQSYPNAWEPALTSLANGTLVLVYVQFNTSFLLPYLDPYFPPVSELMLTESYTGGSSWTTPIVLNESSDPSLVGVSFPQLRPTVTAIGQTIYVSWMTMDIPPINYGGVEAYSAVSVLVSTNGGQDWSPVIAVASSPYSNYGNPDIAVNSTGAIFLAYAGYLPYDGEVFVAVSTDNFTSWSSNYVDFSGGEPLLGPFGLVAPKLAWNALWNEWYVAWAGTGPFVCNPYCAQVTVPYLYNSTDGGQFWNDESAAYSAYFNPNDVTTAVQPGYNDSPYADAGVYDVEIAVTPSNNLEMMALYSNQSLCYGTECGYLQEAVVNSSNGSSYFSGPYDLNGTRTWGGYGWPGETTSVLAGDSKVWYSWVQMTCPSAPRAQCSPYSGSPLVQSQVMVSTAYSGPTVTATFTASGLNASTLWQVDLLGNVRVGPGTSSLVISGVPTNSPVDWSIAGANNTTEFAFYPVAQSVYPVATASTSFTDTVTFHEYVPFTIWMTPGTYANPQWYWPNCATQYSYPGSYYETFFNGCVAVNVTPWLPGTVHWVPVGTAQNLSINTWNPLWVYCESQFSNKLYPDLFCEADILNLTFLSWSGSGPGSVTSNTANITVTPLGPVNETVNFANTGSCSGYWDSYQGTIYERPSCGNITTALTFTEHGLPTGTNWGVSLVGPGGATTTGTSTSSAMALQNINVATYYAIQAWTIPTANPSQYWVATCEVGAGIVPPRGTPIDINYTLESLTGTSFNVTIYAEGLPSGTPWTYTVGSGSSNTSYVASGSSTTLALEGGTSYSFSAPFLASNTSEGFGVTGVSYGVNTMNSTNAINISQPADFELTGFANLTFWYAPYWWVTTLAGANGAVSPSSEWAENDSGLLLTATPNAGYIFVGWSGSGPGATGLSQRHSASVVIRPTGPVTEVASFAPRPAPTWTLTVSENGLPGQQMYTVDLGGRSYTGNGTFAVTNLTTENVTVSMPDVFDSSNAGLRYVPGAPSSSFGVNSGTINITSNGTLTASFTTQYLLTVAGTAGGTVSSAGGSWQNSGATVSLTATPLPHYQFNGWNGTGVGGRTSKSEQINIVIGGVVTETASFSAVPPPPPATYTLTVSESGLPATAAWGFTLSTGGASGTGSLVLAGLNGSYTIGVPVVYTAAGVRYVPNGSTSYTEPVSVSSGNATWSVSFTEQVLVTIQTSGEGTATGTSGWVATNVAIALSATPASGWEFAGWSGTGPGASQSANASTSITPSTGPITETATFTQAPPPATTTGSTSSGLPLALGLLVALLIAGLVVGMLLARRRRRSPPPPEPMESWQEAPTDTESPASDGS